MNEVFDEAIKARKDIRDRLFDGRAPSDDEIIYALSQLAQKKTIEELCISGLLSDGHEKDDYLEEILSIVVSHERFVDLKKHVGWDEQ